MQITIISSAQLKEHLESSTIFYDFYETVAGSLIVLFTSQGIFESHFIENKNISFPYEKKNLNCSNLILSGTAFQNKVWQAALEIKPGNKVTYHDVAKFIGHEKSYRAVANALAQNKLAYFIPCHRVVRKNGTLGGYKWGIDKKASLLNIEFDINI